MASPNAKYPSPKVRNFTTAARRKKKGNKNGKRRRPFPGPAPANTKSKFILAAIKKGAMQIQLENQPYSSIHADALVTYIFDDDQKIEGVLVDIDSAMDGRIAALAASGEITGKSLATVMLHFPEGMDAKRLLRVGAGKGGKFTTGDLRKIAGTALRYLKSRGVKKFVFLARESERNAAALQAVVEALTVADFESNKYHTEKKKNEEIQTVLLAGFDASQDLPEALDHGRIIAESQNFARDLINQPSNRLTPP